MRNKLAAIVLVMFVTFTACSKEEEKNPQQVPMAGTHDPNVNAAHRVTVEEVQNVSSYSYLKVKEGEKEYWMAVTKGNFKVGEVLLYNKSMEMKDFHSKELNKTFETVYFVDDLSEALGAGTMNQPQKPNIEKEKISVSPASSGVTIAQLYSNMNAYNGKTAKVKGQVVKINNGIMGKNWIHIQDGTSNGADFDLTVTTNDIVNMGDVVTFQGKIATNKDFGYGYSYKLMMEEAKALKPL